MGAGKAPKPCHRIIYNNIKRNDVPLFIDINWNALGYSEFENGFYRYNEAEILNCLLEYQRKK